MSAPRIATSVLVGALLRKADQEGGFGAVLAKGDDKAGELIVIFIEKGQMAGVYERLLQPDGNYSWQPAPTQLTDNSDKIQEYLARKRRFDPDIWLIELDVASAERFAAEMNALN